MTRIENTVFISYRRTDVYTALAVYENLTKHGYDVFFDYTSISSGDFEQIITTNIRARAHFLLILTPTALDRLNQPGDWLRREIEIAIAEKRNIVPLFFKGFRFGAPSDTLTGKLRSLSRYNGLNVHEDYFQEAMQRVRTQFLNIPLNTVLHPVSTEVQMAVKEEQIAADKALEQIEDVKGLVGRAEEEVEELNPASPVSADLPMVQDRRAEEITEKADRAPTPKLPFTPGAVKDEGRADKLKKTAPKLNPRILLGGGALLAVIGLAVILFPTLRNRFAPGIGSTMTGKDGMTLVYVPAGEFAMGNDNDSEDEKPVHTVTLDAFWIDQTEVTNAMYAKCVQDGACDAPSSTKSYTRDSYYGNAVFDNYPAIYVSWEDAAAYCSWADRRLPTEAEWEKAARGESAFIYPWGNDFDGSLVNFCDKNCSFDWADKNSDDGYADTAPIGSYPDGASPYGALDMAGNVWEWVADWYDENYYDTLGENASNPLGPDSGQIRALRGGSWNFIDYEVRSARRGWGGPTNSDVHIGFRCVFSETEPVQSAPLAQAATDTPSSIQTSQPTITNPPSLPTESSLLATPTPGIGSTMISDKDSMTLLYVPPSEFTMGSDSGSDDEKPVHTVYLDAFWIDQTEVTNQMYASCVEAGVCEEPTNTSSHTHSSYYGNADFGNYPVIYVNWNMAKTYCEWVNRRLPTEAEWEKAARGENALIYPWGDDFDGTRVNFCDTDCSFNWADRSSEDGYADTAPVGSYSNGASPYGALDMAGNVWEWVNDWYSESYSSSPPSSNPEGPASGQYRVLRGGSWVNDSLNVRSADRNSVAPAYTINSVGFRCAISADP